MALIHPATLADVAAYAVPALGLFARRGGRTNRRHVGDQSGAGVQTPLTIITSVPVAQWIRSDLGITIGTGVSAWADQTSNHRDFTQATGGSQPTYNASDATIGNRPSVATDGVAQFLDSTWSRPAPGTTPTWMWFIFKQVAWTGNAVLIGDLTVNRFLLQQFTASPQVRSFDGTAGPTTNALAVGTWGRGILQIQNTTADSLKLGSGAPVTGTALGNNVGTGTKIGCNGGGVNFGKATWTEVVITLGVPNATEKTNMDSYGLGLYPSAAF